MHNDFVCPLPWMSLSFGPNSTPRVCCHQSGILKNSNDKNFEEVTSLKHNKIIQDQMLKGEIPDECLECHQLEKNGCTSPRQHYKEIFGSPKDKIEYLDITMDNRCNLECIMCSPHYSHRLNSFFQNELKTLKIEKWDFNFSKNDIHSLLPDLKMLTLTGGEPLISTKAMDLLSHISQSGHASHIDLRLFSNLSVLPDEIASIFKNFKKVEFILSIDSIGENYEFIRYPAKWIDVESNVKTLQNLNLPHLTINIHAILMASNWNHFTDLLKYYKESGINSHSLFPITVEIENPKYLHPTVLSPKEFESGLEEMQNYINSTYPQNPSEEKQIEDLLSLLEKIKGRDFKQNHIEYKAYMAKLKHHRG